MREVEESEQDMLKVENDPPALVESIHGAGLLKSRTVGRET